MLLNIHCRTSERIFNIGRFAARTKVFTSVMRGHLYADGFDQIPYTEVDIQHILYIFSDAFTALQLAVKLHKTVVMYQPAPG